MKFLVEYKLSPDAKTWTPWSHLNETKGYFSNIEDARRTLIAQYEEVSSKIQLDKNDKFLYHRVDKYGYKDGCTIRIKQLMPDLDWKVNENEFMIESPKNVLPGQLYNVPCIDFELGKYGIQSIPVILPAHTDDNDNCLNKLDNHYHIDFRFIDRGYWLKESGAKSEDTNALLDVAHEKVPFLAQKRALKSRIISTQKFIWFVNRWQNRYPNQKIKAHGLAWNLETGEYKYQAPFYLQLMPNGPMVAIPDTDKILKFEFEIDLPEGFVWNKYFCLVDSLGQKYADLEEPCENVNYKDTDTRLKISYDLTKTCVKI